MNSIIKFGDLITNKLKNGETLQSLKSDLEVYSGVSLIKFYPNLLESWIVDITNSSKGYHKIKVYSNEYIDIFIIYWNANQKSKIHDHPEKGCLMKVLDGELQENVYQELKLIDSNILNIGDIGYREGNVYLHDIIPIKDSVSLHIYYPSGYKTNYY